MKQVNRKSRKSFGLDRSMASYLLWGSETLRLSPSVSRENEGIQLAVCVWIFWRIRWVFPVDITTTWDVSAVVERTNPYLPSALTDLYNEACPGVCRFIGVQKAGLQAGSSDQQGMWISRSDPGRKHKLDKGLQERDRWTEEESRWTGSPPLSSPLPLVVLSQWIYRHAHLHPQQ